MSEISSSKACDTMQHISSDDEPVWIERLYGHVDSHLAPLVPKVSSSDLQRAVLQALQAGALRVPTEYDLLTVQTLCEKFRNSFRVDLHPCDDTEPQEDALPQVPAVMLGVLGVSGRDGSHGELVLKDGTGDMICEVCYSNVPLHLVGEVVLLQTWNFIYSGDRSYLEIEDMCPLFDCAPSVVPLPSEDAFLGVDELPTYLKRKGRRAKARISVYGKVTAVSEVHRNGPGEHLLLLQVSDTQSDDFTCTVVVLQTLKLLHLGNLIRIFEVYAFSRLKDMIMHKGSPSERRVLATSDETQIHPYSSLPHEACPPSRKRIKAEDRGSSIPLQATSKQLTSGYGEVAAVKVASHALVSYKGTVTKCILPEAGVYELDGRVHLYLTHSECLNMCRGMRRGAVVELHNVHVLKLSGTPWKAFIGKNKLAGLAKKYCAMDAAWILELYVVLLQKDKRRDARVCFPFLEQVCRLAGVSTCSRNVSAVCAEFMSHGDCCHLLQHVDLSGRPEVPTIDEFKRSVGQAITSAHFCWQEDQQDGATSAEVSPFVTFAVSAQWSFGSVRNSDMQHPQILVGHLRGNNKTAGIELADSTGSMPVICNVPLQSEIKQPKCPIVHFGSKVLINKPVVFVEKTTEGQCPPDITAYINVNEIAFALKAQRKPPSGVTNIRSRSEELENTDCLYFFAVSKNALVVQSSSRSTSSSLSFTMQALVHANADILQCSLLPEHLRQKQEQGKHVTPPLTIVLNFPSGAVHWYSYISIGCLYTLSVASGGLPSFRSLTKERCVTIGDSMEINFLHSVEGFISCYPPILDVAEVISKFYLPQFSTASRQEFPQRTQQELVSFKGVILKHDYRINHEMLVAGGIAASSLDAEPAVGQIQPYTSSRIIALTIQSLKYPDTMMVYCSHKQGIPLQLGLLPGSVATMHSFKLKSSRFGNVYCMSCASSSIEVNLVKSVAVDPQRYLRGVPPEMSAVPTVYLSELMDALLHGCLSGRVVCVKGNFVSVQHACLQFMCQGCQHTSVDGSCMPTCLHKKPMLKAEARLILEDGTGEGHVYVSDHLVPGAMGIPGCDWSDLCDLVQQVGQVTYNKPLTGLHQLQGEAVGRPSIQERAQQMLATIPSLHNRMKIYCQPFVSSAELKESVIGQKFHTVRLGAVTEYVTLTLPRLQLRAIALTSVNCAFESAMLLESLDAIP